MSVYVHIKFIFFFIYITCWKGYKNVHVFQNAFTECCWSFMMLCLWLLSYYLKFEKSNDNHFIGALAHRISAIPTLRIFSYYSDVLHATSTLWNTLYDMEFLVSLNDIQNLNRACALKLNNKNVFLIQMKHFEMTFKSTIVKKGTENTQNNHLFVKPLSFLIKKRSHVMTQKMKKK